MASRRSRGIVGLKLARPACAQGNASPRSAHSPLWHRASKRAMRFFLNPRHHQHGSCAAPTRPRVRAARLIIGAASMSAARACWAGSRGGEPAWRTGWKRRADQPLSAPLLPRRAQATFRSLMRNRLALAFRRAGPGSLGGWSWVSRPHRLRLFAQRSARRSQIVNAASSSEGAG